MKEKFIDKVKKIQQENKGKIVLVRSGIFLVLAMSNTVFCEFSLVSQN